MNLIFKGTHVKICCFKETIVANKNQFEFFMNEKSGLKKKRVCIDDDDDDFVHIKQYF